MFLQPALPHFNESVFPPLEGEKSVLEERREITWNASTMPHFDPCTNKCELKVRKFKGSLICKILQINY